MKQYFKIHGDNVVECERIAALILTEVAPLKIEKSLMSPSTITIDISFQYDGSDFDWHLELLPGFNKAGRARWRGDIFEPLRNNGSFLDETPDAIITEIQNDREQILCAIEFCSALQAGNQAWQRSGRAFSTGRTGCPYLYIVDFVKYELDPKTRERKNLRFPNAAVPYSYINFSRVSQNFVAQVYVKSESFDKTRDASLANFDEENFGDVELRRYLVKKMAHIDTTDEEELILLKNFNVVRFLAELTNSNTNLSVEEWDEVFNNDEDVVDYCVDNQRFNFHKIVTQKGMHGQLARVLAIIDRYSAGLASKDLPIGIIPANNRPAFAKALHGIYPAFDSRTIDEIADPTTNLILCLFKGFKPRGDDNRPDRGLLPLAAMLSDNDNEIMTILYGPILYRNYQLLMNNADTLARNNGLWKSILALSNYVLLDAPILGNSKVKDVEELLFTTGYKQQYMRLKKYASLIEGRAFSSAPQEYHEDDVDTGIHYLFTEVLKPVCFEGMCNPPGGDWSGFSVLDHNSEKRWLSLPRVSDEIDGKRPDHIIEIFGVQDKPILLSIESKERSADLEDNVGSRLITYIEHLMGYIPNVEKDLSPDAEWQRGSGHVNKNDFVMVSAAAYLKEYAQSSTTVHQSSNCDMLFVMSPVNNGWTIEITSFTPMAQRLELYLKRLVGSSPNSLIMLQ